MRALTQTSDGETGVDAVASRGKPAFDRVTVGRAIAAFVIYEIAFWLAYRYGMTFSHATASPFWFPDSVLLAALLFSPRRWWWAFLLGALPLRLFLPEASAIPAWFLWSAFFIDSAKGIVTAAALRHFLADPLKLRTVKDFVLYCVVAVLLVPAVAALAGAGIRSALGDEFWLAWQQWFFGNMLAHVVVTPALLWGIPAAVKALAGLRRVRWFEGAIVVIGLVATSYVAFQTPPGAGGFADPRFFLLVPFMFWAALRFGIVGASGAVLVTSIICVEKALDGQGPFAGFSPDDKALALQQFLLLRAAPLYFVSILFEQKRAAEVALTRSERRFREVVDSQTEVVCRFLPGGSLSFVNEAFCRAFQRRQPALLGSDFFALMSPDVRDMARTQVERAGQQIVERGEWECQEPRDDGTFGWRQWLCHPIVGPGGEPDEFQAIGQDVTDRKHAEESDRSLTHASRLAVIGELTAMVAHEINQPLGAILSNADAAELLLDRPHPPLDEIREIVSHIRSSDLRASGVIQRIRAMSSKHEIELQPIDLNETIADVVRLAAADLRRNEIAVHDELSPSLPLVSGDRVHLQQVLLNLIVNAIDAMNDTPAADRLLTLTTLRDGPEKIEVIVTDCGHGIAPDKLTGIFDSFYTTKLEGTGLGLSIARSIVRAHHGRIWAENRRGGGAAFHLTLTIA